MAKFPDEKLVALKNEIIMAEAINREELLPICTESLHRYIGDFVPPVGFGWDILLNEVYPIIQNNLPSIFFRNPRAFLKPRSKTYIAKKLNPVTGRKEDTVIDSTLSARTQEHILNYSVSEMDYKKEARKTLLDALLFPYGVMWHGYKGDFGMTEEQSIFIKDEKVFVKRISPLRFIHDPKVTISNLEEARWVGRIIDVPINEIIEDDKLDVDKKLIKGFKGFGEKVGKGSESKVNIGGKDIVTLGSNKKALLDYTANEFQESSDARFVRVYEIFLRPSKKEKRNGDNGWILLLTDEQNKPLRQSPWGIKAEGFPAHILEFNELPDNLFGLCDVDTYKQVADQKNAIINLQLRNAQENTKVWVGLSKEGANEEDITKIQRGENTIITFESGNPKDRMFVASGGGQASGELYLIDQRIQKNLEDKSGVTDLKRGFLQSGEESAASVKIRNAGGAARPAYRQDLMAEFLKKSFHYINQLNKQFVPYDDAVRIVGSLDLEWSDKPSKEDLQADTDVEIDVISMLPENPEKEIQEVNSLLIMMFNALQTPEIREKLLQEGKTINLSPLIEQLLMRMKIRNPDVFRNIKPEESEGYVSVKEMREANENVNAALMGSQVPFPPTEKDDHRAKIEVYMSVQKLLQAAGQVSDTLEQLIQVQSALLQKVMEKDENVGQQIQLPRPKVEMIGG